MIVGAEIRIRQIQEEVRILTRMLDKLNSELTDIDAEFQHGPAMGKEPSK